MKIALFGATGRVGGEVLKLALAAGHEVTALVRSPEKLTSHGQLTIIQGDVCDAKAVARAISQADVVFSALGTDKTNTLTEAVPHMIRAMEETGVSRIVTIGTAGILQSRTESEKLRYEAGDSNRRLTFAAEEHHKVYDMLHQSGLDWTIVCPTYLPDGAAVGDYRTERDLLPEEGKQISVGDTANFAYDELMEGYNTGFRVGISY
ncbi:NAD(P)-dependent oxidoreductase [Sporosarcina sp. G11-34]|uniref:NAD(P)-dependent oxidoreductase n=1 Tax=Sporosarcina sp. G11-34 TaxID=2849605 RepID=UPI0022A9F5D6|nr:SDR family oxidoreductase [Sporosarcina sp. G11-34]MCZ2259303.1 SDR family oxidoreductase [Sporosarcina sp. G11-34]